MKKIILDKRAFVLDFIKEQKEKWMVLIIEDMNN